MASLIKVHCPHIIEIIDHIPLLNIRKKPLVNFKSSMAAWRSSEI
uniref:Uncharacterized protein n=1 Tax=Rhizophora mucronata TaxID=61149 RepID=A0A2P2QPG9_RHIMU